MKLKQSFRFMLRDYRGASMIFYLIMLCIMALSLFGALNMSLHLSANETTLADAVGGSFAGCEIASIIFLFVCGLNAYTDQFSMLAQNGVTRRTFFTGHLAASGAVSLLFAVIDRALLFFCDGIGRRMSFPVYSYAFFDLLNQEMDAVEGRIYSVDHPTWQSFVSTLGLYFFFPALGFLIVLVFKRLSRTGCALVGAGVPITLFVVCPLLDTLLFQGRIGQALSDLALSGLRMTVNNPFAFLGIAIGATLVLCLLSWLLLRRIPLKK